MRLQEYFGLVLDWEVSERPLSEVSKSVWTRQIPVIFTVILISLCSLGPPPNPEVTSIDYSRLEGLSVKIENYTAISEIENNRY